MNFKNITIFVFLTALYGLKSFAIDNPNRAGGDIAAPVYYDIRDNCNSERSGPFTDYETGGNNVSLADARVNNSGALDFWNVLGTSLFVCGLEARPEPNNSGDCAYLFTQNNGDRQDIGNWDDTSCSQQKKVACFNGYEWAISANAVSFDGGSGESMENPQNACRAISRNGVSGNFKFAAPVSVKDNLDIVELGKNEGGTGIWINLQDKKHEDTWKFNKDLDVIAPFWGSGQPDNFQGNEHCAEITGTGDWNDISCSTSRKVACYDPYVSSNGQWRKTAGSYSFSTIEAFNLICQNEFGGRYKFYAPVTLSQNDDLKNTAGGNAWINSNDKKNEGFWDLNLELNNWESAQPDAVAANRCVTASAVDATWSAASCSANHSVACSTGGRWYFTTTKTTLENFSDGQRLCDELGQGYQFSAPKNYVQMRSLQYYAEQDNRNNEQVWINGNRMDDFSSWVWNVRDLSIPSWAADEPNGSGIENCAVLTRNGRWEDVNCSTSDDFKFLCKNSNSGSWELSGSVTDVSGNTNAGDLVALGASECRKKGSDWNFVAPATYNDNITAATLLAANEKVWVNATDELADGTWLVNAANITEAAPWGSAQPDNGGILKAAETPLVKGEDCVVQDLNGVWSDVSCTSGAEYPWACTNGSDWRVTRAQGVIGNLSSGHKQCLYEYGPDFVFATPLTKADAIQLDFARLLAAQQRRSSIASVWINMTDGGDEDEITVSSDGDLFRKNLPFTNWQLPGYPGEEPLNSCVFKASVDVGQNSSWLTADCVTQAAHYACFNGSTWRIATGKGKIVSGSLQIVPNVGEDYWSYERGNDMCKTQFGRDYTFSAPVTAAEELALDSAIRSANAEVRNTWINYYYVSEVTSQNDRWFANRLNLGVWQKPEFNNVRSADCVLLHKDGSWTDAECSESDYGYACFNGNWSVVAKNNNGWNAGFSQCAAAANAVFAAPRTPNELETLKLQMGVDPVWINMTDTEVESQWIVNRLRFSWWKNEEPRNNGNKDCAVASSDGWYAEKCALEVKAFACRSRVGTTINWNISTAKGLWSQGFSVCKKEFPESDFYSPVGYGTISATASYQTLESLVSSNGQDVWINLSDREIEGAWRVRQAYQDWGTDSLLNDDQDCAYFDRISVDKPGTWLADRCKETRTSPDARQFACTNGYEWKIVTASDSNKQRWSEGFGLCRGLMPQNTWKYSAPENAVDNARLKLAMELADVNQVWLNAHDRIEEGIWQINGLETNFPPEIDTSDVALDVTEQTTAIQLKAILSDDEEQGVQSAQWTLVSANPTGFDINLRSNTKVDGVNGTAVVTAEYDTPSLLQQDLVLVFRLTTTDVGSGTAAPATSSKEVTVRVKAPILAHYDFNNAAFPERDISSNNKDAENTLDDPMPPLVDGAISVGPGVRMRINGEAKGGLTIPDDSYTIAMRVSVEEGFATGSNPPWRGLLVKGNGGIDGRQPGIFFHPDSNEIHTEVSVSGTPRATLDNISHPLQQWFNLVLVRSADRYELYVDGVKSEKIHTGQAPVANDADIFIGAIPGAAASVVALVDDLQIYNRALTSTERESILPAPPVGEVNFVIPGSQADEFAAQPNNKVAVSLARSRGSNGRLTAYVDFLPKNNATGLTATPGVFSDLSVPSQETDVAFSTQYIPGSGMPVVWNEGDKTTKTLDIYIDQADDTIQEGTEFTRIEVKSTQVAGTLVPGTGTPAGIIGDNNQFKLGLRDLTPNPDGNFSVVAPDPNVVLETNSATQQICIRRESGNEGAVSLNYAISGDAQPGSNQASDDFEYLPSGLSYTGATGTVTFPDGDGADQCFDIRVYNSPQAGVQQDRSIIVELTGITAEPGRTPLLTAQNRAELIIRDYSPGEFGFVTDSYTCKEPNQDQTVPDNLQPTDGELTCTISVQRINTGLYSPEAEVTISVLGPPDPNSPGNNLPASLDLSTPVTISWPAVTNTTPRSLITLPREVQVTIVNDDDQEIDEAFVFSLNPTTGDDLTETITAGGGSVYPTTTLTVTDVTSPALLTIDSGSSTVYEGQKLFVDLSRSGNANTEFDVNRNIQIIGGFGAVTDYIDFSLSNRSSATGTESFAKNGPVAINNLLQIRTKDRSDLGDDYTIRVTLDSPDPSRVVGLGVIDNAGKAAGVNRTSRDYVITNDNNSLNDLSEVSVDASSGQDIKIDSVNYLTTSGKLASRGRVQITLNIPAKSSFNDQRNFSNINYVWDLSQLNGAVRVSGDTSGDISYPDGKGASSASLVLDLPFAKLTNVISSISVNLFSGPDSVQNNADEIVQKSVTFTTQPRWRRIRSRDDTGDCLRWNGSNFVTIPCNGDDFEYWSYDPVERRMVNKGDGALYCATGNGDLVRTTCSNADRWSLSNYSSDFRVRQEGGSEVWCQVGGETVNVRDENFFNCTYENERRWFWD
ncbi:hypothetical protein A3759_13260 [Thalassolituus sp. HI0120]|nr:hypothetical protein A3759_13260 [Thalassolituus sp. HI0120]